MNEKQKPHFVTYEAENSDYEFHDTLEEALKYLNDADYSEGYSREAMDGDNFIAEITHRSKFTETEYRDAYHVHTADCEKNNCELEEWPYGNWDFVGDLTYEPVERDPVETDAIEWCIDIAKLYYRAVPVLSARAKHARELLEALKARVK